MSRSVVHLFDAEICFCGIDILTLVPSHRSRFSCAFLFIDFENVGMGLVPFGVTLNLPFRLLVDRHACYTHTN